MNKIIFIFFAASFFVANAGQLRFRRDHKMDADAQNDQAAPSAGSGAAPSGSGAGATGSETCSATVDGQQQTLKTGDRWCKDKATTSVCSYGEVIDFACPPNSVCLKSPNSYAVICREYRLNILHLKGEPEKPQPGQEQPQNTEPEKQPSAPVSQPKPDQPAQPQPEAPKPSQPEAPKPAEPSPSQPEAPKPVESPKPAEPSAPQPQPEAAKPADTPKPAEPSPSQPEAPKPADTPKPAEPAPSQPEAPKPDEPKPSQPEAPKQDQDKPNPAPAQKPDSPAPPANQPPSKDGCQGTKKGQSVTLKEGESICSGDSTYQICSNGALVSDTCPSGASCKDSPTVNGVVCRIVVKAQGSLGPNPTA